MSKLSKSFLFSHAMILFSFLFLFDVFGIHWTLATGGSATKKKYPTNQLARSHNNQVYIVGHMPPGSDERQLGIQMNGHTTFSSENNLRYLQLVRKYSSIISGQFFGHLHSDSFRIIYSDNGKHISDLFEFTFYFTALPAEFSIIASFFFLVSRIFDIVASRIVQQSVRKSVACSDNNANLFVVCINIIAGKPVSWIMIAPSITPIKTTVGSNNPAMRLYKFDTDTGQVSAMQCGVCFAISSGISFAQFYYY